MRVYLCPKKDNDVKAQIEKLKELAPLDPNAEFPAISVIVPLYNVEKYVGECLDSLLAQTFKNFEIIIVDDCSTDNSVDVVNEYAPKFDGRLILVHMDTPAFRATRALNLLAANMFTSLTPTTRLRRPRLKSYTRRQNIIMQTLSTARSIIPFPMNFITTPSTERH